MIPGSKAELKQPDVTTHGIESKVEGRDTKEANNSEKAKAEIRELPKQLSFGKTKSYPKQLEIRKSDAINSEKKPEKMDANDGEGRNDVLEKQEIADNAAKDYNDKYRPYERAIEKGYKDIEKTKNGGVSFANSKYIYKKEDGTKCIAVIEATGNRPSDFDKASEQLGLSETPDGYVWHHVDDYNVKEGTITLELVEDSAHNATKPHSGGCAQYDAVNGPRYNPAGK